MDGHLLEDLPAREQVVDAQRVQALEDVRGRRDGELGVELIDRADEALDELGGDGVKDDGPALARDAPRVVLGCGRHRARR